MAAGTVVLSPIPLVTFPLVSFVQHGCAKIRLIACNVQHWRKLLQPVTADRQLWHVHYVLVRLYA